MKEENKKLPNKTAKEDNQKKETNPLHTKIEGATSKKRANPAFDLVNFNWLNLTNLKIRSKIIMGFIVITTLLLILGFLVLQSMTKVNEEFTFVIKHDASVIVNAQRLEKLMVDMETGQRGYIITGDTTFLEPYNDGVKQFDSLIAVEIVLVSDNPAQVQRLRAIVAKIKEWQEKAASPEIELGRKVASSTSSARVLEEILTGGIGKNLIDNLRKAVDDLTTNFEKTRNTEGIIAVTQIAKSMVDRETGQRGFLLTGQDEFLEPYIEGGKQFNIKMNELRRIVSNDRYNRELAEKINALAQEWEEKAAIPEINAREAMNKNPELLEDIGKLLKKGTGKDILDELRDKFIEFIAIENELTKSRTDSANNTAKQTKLIIYIMMILTPFISIVIGIGVSNVISRPLIKLKDAAVSISEGDLDAEIEKGSGDEIGDLAAKMEIMRNSIKSVNEQNVQQNWLLEGNNLASEQMKGEKTARELAESLINTITPYLDGQMGAFYIRNEENGSLKLLASYAFDKRNQSNNTIDFGEGLIGQAAAEKKSIIFYDIPEDYFMINSGLGKLAPKHVMVFPVIFQEEVKGVIEVATAHRFTDLQLEFVKNINESIGIAINTSQSRDQLNELFEKAKKQAEDLEAQQEELRQTNEELEEQTQLLKESETKLKAQSEELQVSNEELEEKTENLEKQKVEVEEARNDLERKARELALASKYKSEFLANMSHELRTPLNSLLILSKDLENNDDGNLTKEQVDSAKVIHSGGEDLLSLINDILDLSKVEAGKLTVNVEEVKIQTIINNINNQFGPIAKNKKLKFEIIKKGKLPNSIKTDGLRVEQILKNLLSNAFKFTEKGSVALDVHLPPQNTKFRNAHLTPENTIGLSVVDTGIGIEKDKHHAIFEAFQQAEGGTSRIFGGTGLGLTISREFSKILGGEIHLDSKEGLGSTFTLYLPIEYKKSAVGEMDFEFETVPAVQIEKPTKALPHGEDILEEALTVFIPDDRQEVSKADRSILIIEDDKKFAKILLGLARDQKYKCLVAGDGISGLALAKEYMPSAILLDLILPDIDGLRVLDNLKFDLDTRHIPVHVISFKEEKKASLSKGAVGFLAKPAKAEDINSVFKRLEEFNKAKLRELLIVEDDINQQKALHKLLKNKGIKISMAATGKQALKQINSSVFDCIILDLKLPDTDGFELIQKISDTESHASIPIIVYTGADLSPEEYHKLNEYTETIIIKGVNSPERLLDEVSLFLHSVETELPEGQRKIIDMFHSREEVIKGKKVLLVDDDLRNTFALSKSLQKQGLEVVLADNGKLALEKLKSEKGIDIVIMDVMMPVMDGYEATRRIRMIDKFKNLPIIALTAKAMPEDKAKCMEAGANDYITKPVEIEKLLSMMRVWLFSKNGNKYK